MRKPIIGIIFSTLAISLLFGVSKNSPIKEAKADTYTQSVTDYYSSINWNKTGADLKTDLFNKIKITTAGWSYDGLWDAYKTTDVRPDGLHYWDIYSDSTDYTLNDNRINHSYSAEGDSINREHVIPQSSFNKAAPMKSDVHHVLPSDGYVNNRRSSYPHGNVTSTPTYTSNDGCKLGKGTGNTTVFEPMPQYKGDIARIYFYFVTCYQNKMGSNSFSAFDGETYPSIKTAYLNVYLQWAKEDPVSQKEIDRNNAAYAGQGNRNPFVDCPYAVGAIWDSAHATDYGVKGAYTTGEGVTISKTSASLITGGTTTISATSSNAANISWSTSNSSVASISSNSSSSGNSITITAGNAGTATITASATISGKTYSKTCSVTVSATKQVASLSLSGQKTTFTVDDTFSFGGTVTASYNDGTTANVTASASFTGYNMSTSGTQTVTVSYSYGGATATETYEITVSASGSPGDQTLTIGVDDIPTVYSGDSFTIDDNIEFGCSNIGSSYTDGAMQWKSGQGYMYNITPLSNLTTISMATASSTFTGTIYVGSSEHPTSGTSYAISNGSSVSITGSPSYFTIQAGTVSGGAKCGAITIQYGAPAKTLTSIEVDTSPNKLEYEVGDYFDPTGLIITRYYSDGSDDNYAYTGHTTDFSFNPSLSSQLTIDDDTIEIIYGGESCFFEIDIEYPLVLDSIEASGYKSSFKEGDTFSFGGAVIANYEDGSVADVTSSATFSGYDLTVLGNQTVTVSYGGETTTYPISVSAGTLSSIAVSEQTTSYVKNGAFSFDGVCTATFANGYQKEVTPTSVTTPDLTTSGNKTVTVTYTYNGTTKTTSYTITVSNYRNVYEESYSEIGTITYTNDTEEKSTSSLSTSASGGYSAIDTQYHAWRLGSSGKTGTLTVSSTSSNIYKIVVNARYYSNDSGTTFTVGGDSKTLTNSYADYIKEYTTATNSVAISSVTNGKRVLIATITVYTKSTNNIGQSADCSGLETFINNCMHMDYVNSLGYCKDSTHHYYSTAKAAFNALNAHQRSLFTTNIAYDKEWERLSTWAAFNGESLNASNLLAANEIDKTPVATDNGLIVAIISILGILSVGGFSFIKKKKEN